MEGRPTLSSFRKKFASEQFLVRYQQLFDKLKRSRNCNINVSDSSLDLFFFLNSSTETYNKANSKMEKYINGSEKIVSNSLNHSDIDETLPLMESMKLEMI